MSSADKLAEVLEANNIKLILDHQSYAMLKADWQSL